MSHTTKKGANEWLKFLMEQFGKIFWYLTVGFFCNNLAFNVLLQLQSSLNPTMGPISISIEFVSAILCSLFIAPILFNITSQRWQFTLSSAGYIMYPLANISPNWYTMVSAALILGFGCGVSWAAVTLFIANLAADNNLFAPLLYSVFTGIVQCSSIAGNLIATAVMKYFKVTIDENNVKNGTNSDVISNLSSSCVQFSPNLDDSETIVVSEDISDTGEKVLLCILFLCHVLATIVLYFGISGRYAKLEFDPSNAVNHCKTIKTSLFNMAVQITVKYQLLLAPVTIYSGAVLSFIQTDITRHLIKPCLGITNVPLLMIFYGIGISSGCFISSTLCSKIPVKHLLFMVAAVDYFGFINLCFWKGDSLLYLVIAIVVVGLGFTSGLFMSITPTLYAALFKESGKTAFALWNVLFSCGCALVFGWSDFLQLPTKCISLISLLTISLVGLYYIPLDDRSLHNMRKEECNSRWDENLLEQ